MQYLSVDDAYFIMGIERIVSGKLPIDSILIETGKREIQEERHRGKGKDRYS